MGGGTGGHIFHSGPRPPDPPRTAPDPWVGLGWVTTFYYIDGYFVRFCLFGATENFFATQIVVMLSEFP